MKKALLLVAVLVAIAPASAEAQRACLRAGYIRNWEAVNEKTIIVENDWSGKFRVGLKGACHDIKFHRPLSFKVFGGDDLSCVQVGDQVISHDFNEGPLQRCIVTHIETYTPEMEKADHAGAQPARDERGGY